MNKQATIYDIAKATKLTASTVSRALRNHPDISEKTKKRVHAAAKKLKYKHNVAASSLRTGKTKVIAVVVPEINNHFFSNVIAGIEEKAYKHGYNLIICQSNESWEKEVEIFGILMQQHIACIMVSLSKTTINTSHVAEAIKHNIPVIQFDRTDAELNTLQVVNDNIAPAVDAVKHLYNEGYRSIAFLAGPKNINIFQQRFEGFRKGLEETGLPFHKNWVVFDCLTKNKAKDVLLQLLQSHPRPDAVLASADLAALGALEAAKALHLRVPEDFGICGYSNEPYTETTTPRLTTIEQFSTEMGRDAFQLFLDCVITDKKSLPEPVVIQPELVIRESSLRETDPATLQQPTSYSETLA